MGAPFFQFLSVKTFVSFWLVVSLLLGNVILYLEQNDDTRHEFFAFLASFLNRRGAVDFVAHRCETLKETKGYVLELGPGPGSNFECFAKLPRGTITEWVGVENNQFMESYLVNNAEKHNLDFKVELRLSTAERLGSIADASVDTVISTHVLCSVADRHAVLAEVGRVLKPGGKFIFLEHVSAPEGTWMHLIQRVILPVWKIIGDGCDFIPTWLDMEGLKDSGLYERVDYTLYDAPINPPFVKPHISGVAVRAGSGSGSDHESS